MIKVKEIPFIGYPVTDKKRARDFYEGLLGLTPTMDMDLEGGYWTEYDIGAGTLAISNFWKPAVEPKMGQTIALEVTSFEDTLALLKSKGVPLVDGPHESPVCFMVMVTDPDGNSLWIHQRKSGTGASAEGHKVLEIPFVCCPVTDKERALGFYQGILGLSFDTDHVAPDGFWTEASVGSGTLALCSFWKPSAEPSMAPSLALEVEDYESAISILQANGVPFNMETMETPVCHFAVILDPDGNSLLIHKHK